MNKEQLDKTKWAKGFKKDSPVSYSRALQYALQEPLYVHIYKNAESGTLLYSIVASGDDIGFWMDSYKTKKEAVALCKKMGWKIK